MNFSLSAFGATSISGRDRVFQLYLLELLLRSSHRGTLFKNWHIPKSVLVAFIKDFK